MTAWGRARGWALVAVMVGGCLVSGTSSAAAQTLAQRAFAEKITASGELLDINSATAKQLRSLPGMGDAYAARIVAGRPYTAKNQLTMRGILPVAAYEQIKPLIIAHRVKR